jgi:hypothetical protein
MNLRVPVSRRSEGLSGLGAAVRRLAVALIGISSALRGSGYLASMYQFYDALRLSIIKRDAGIFPEVTSDRGLVYVSLEFCGEDVQFGVYVAAEEPIVYVDSHYDDDIVTCATV